jgi:hypothetical protein
MAGAAQFLVPIAKYKFSLPVLPRGKNKIYGGYRLFLILQSQVLS